MDTSVEISWACNAGMNEQVAQKSNETTQNMGKKKQDTTQAAPVAPQVHAGNKPEQPNAVEMPQKTPRYVVVREGHRVSDREYATSDDPEALKEAAFWKKTSTEWSWGDPVEIVLYDNKLHRIW